MAALKKAELFWEGGIDWSHLEPETETEKMGIWNGSRISNEGRIIPKCRAWVKVTNEDGRSYLRSIEESKDLMKPEWYREIREATGKVYDFESRRADSRSNGEVVYFVMDERSNAVKIGWTSKSVDQRLRQLQTGNPNPIRFLGAIFGSLAIEAQIHDHFAYARIQGEWFRVDDLLMTQIEGILQDGWPIP